MPEAARRRANADGASAVPRREGTVRRYTAVTQSRPTVNRTPHTSQTSPRRAAVLRRPVTAATRELRAYVGLHANHNDRAAVYCCCGNPPCRAVFQRRWRGLTV